MSQAKGVLPKQREDTRTLFANPKMCGYFIGVTLRPDLDRAGVQEWLKAITGHVDALVARLPPDRGDVEGEKVAAVAVGLSPSFFMAGGASRFDPPIELPAGFDVGTPEDPNVILWDSASLSAVPRMPADLLFYVASVYEARVANFIEAIQATAPDVMAVTVDRGYQRVDGDEPFGYRDGVRNVLPRGRRPEVVFIHPDQEVEEPRGADGGSYLAFLRIEQLRPAFAALVDDGARDSAIGRHRDGTRLDLPGVHPEHEPTDPPPNLPAASHVRKAGPRGRHDDVQIFRRGLPFLDVAEDRVRVGLNFASFQASLDQLDTVLNDWIFSTNFPTEGAGPDRILDPAGGLTTMEKIGLFFVPPHDPRHLAATLFDAPPRRARTGRLVVRKRVVDPADGGRRFERGGFTFRILDELGQQVGQDFISTTSGRAVFADRLTIGSTYTLVEVNSPIPVTPVGAITFVMTRPNQQVRVLNTVLEPNTPYGG
jgi:Dyp-type peroxidase family